MTLYQKLSWFIRAGVTETIGETPVNRLVRRSAQIAPEQPPVQSVVSAPSAAESIALTAAQQAAGGATTLTELYAVRAAFDGCPLTKTAAHTVNGCGVSPPTLLCILEAPDAAEDKEGRLGVGPAGELLQKMLAAIGMDVNQNTYVTTLTPWRAPGNRKLTETEAALCRPFWEKEIELIKPKMILLFGAAAAKALLDLDSLPKARAGRHMYRDIPVHVTIPPATLMKLPAQKKQAWEDLQKVQKELQHIN